MNTRAQAVQVLYSVLHEGRSLSDELPIAKKQCKNAQDGAFLQALCFGVLRIYPRLSLIANQFLQNPIKEKDIDVLYLICVGLYQLMEMRVLPHAALSETVEAARQLQKPWATGLINGVLRNFQRKTEGFSEIIENNLEAKYAHPHWLIDAIKKAWPEDFEEILIENNTPPPLILRVNLQKIKREEYLNELANQNINAEVLPFTKGGIVLQTPEDITGLPGFKEGLFSVQDGAAQFAADCLNLAPGLHVLDACAAPGGKTTHILEMEPKLSELIAIDISPLRIKSIEENLARLNLQAFVLAADATHPKTWWKGKLFDRILLDAPCSGTGVIRRHPDIKYLRHPQDINQLAEQQQKLLQSLWPLLTSGGILLYVTCSILPQENRDVVKCFLDQQPDALLLTTALPYGYPQSIGHQLLPGQNKSDGFYYAAIAKR